MSTCMSCGGRRENNILRHRPSCPRFPDTAKAVVEVGTHADVIRLHPDLADLDAHLDQWYPREAA